jgi:hypothetical protein
MKNMLLFAMLTSLAGSVVASDPGPRDEVTAAARKPAAKSSYSWRTTIVVPPDSPFQPGPTDGKTEKDGYTQVKLSFGDNTTEFVLKGDHAAVTSPEGAWQALSEVDTNDWPGRFLTMMIRSFKAPAAQAAELAAFTKALKKDGSTWSGDLTEEGAKAFLTFRRGGGATVSNGKGSVKFWLKDGLLTKYEFKVTGTVSFNGRDMDVDRTTTVEIKDVGATKVEVPEAATKKLS